MPELAELAELRTKVGDLDRAAMDAKLTVDDLAAEQRKIDADVESVKARRKRDQDRMDQGLVSNPKDLQHMSEELTSLDRRISSLEDQEIEVMEQLEEAQGHLDEMAAALTEARARAKVVIASRDATAASVRAELAEAAEARGGLVAALSDDLVALYERLRAAKDGVGAARLRAARCGGCQLTVDAAEVGAIRAADEDKVVRCPECQRILVRTAESGL